MGAQGGAPGRADYLALGDWNAVCSMCGRKRKFTTMERNWQGLYRCPEHNEPRQPQDFVANVKDIMTVPYSLPAATLFTPFANTFPARAVPALIDSAVETGGLWYTPEVIIQTPSWVDVVSYAWTWAVGGLNLTIESPSSIATAFVASTQGATGTAQCLVTDSLNGTATVLVPVSIPPNYVLDSEGNIVYDSYGNPVKWSGS